MSILAINKTVSRDYQILEEFEAGLVLTGQEVKSVKSKHVDFKGSFISIRYGEAWLKKLFIAPYSKAGLSLKSYNPIRDRKLLLHRKEVLSLTNKTDSKGLTIIPISVYTSRRLIKVKLALVKGKKKFDKRADIKKREINRNIQQRLKNY